MYEYEISQLRSAELIRQAEQERLARAVVRGRRAARREATARSTEDTVSAEAHTYSLRRHRRPRAA